MIKDISSITKEQIKELILEQKSGHQIGAILDISYSSVRVLIIKYELDELFQKHKPKKRHNPEYDKNLIVNEAKKLIKKHGVMSKSKLAGLLGISYQTLNHAINNTNVPIKEIRNHKISNVDFLEFMKTNPKTKKQITDHFNIRVEYVTRLLKQNNIPDVFPINMNKPAKQELIQFIIDNNVPSYKQLMNQFNVAKPTISKWLRSYSIKLSDFKEINKPSKQELIQFIKDNNGSSYKQLMDQYNVPESTINGWLKSYSIKLKNYSNKPTKQELNQFIINNNGSSYKQLMNQYNVPKTTISKWLRSYSIKLSDFKETIKRPSKQELIQFIINNNGSSYKQLYEKYNVKTATISSWFRSYSIKLSDFKSESIFYYKDQILNLSDKPHKSHISIKDLDYDNVVLLIKREKPLVYVEKDGQGKTTTPKALIEEYIRKD